MTVFHHTPLGWMEIRTGPGEIKALWFSDEPEEVESEASSNALSDWCIRELDEYFAGTRRTFSFPYRQEGTVFQQQVWKALEQIPYGQTISYNQLAHQLGNPKVIRAAARANGQNNLAIVVPCHRVIGSDSQLTGYAGGLWRKQWLLEQEARFAHGVQSLF